ncbi:Zn-dependent protease [Haladaptatus sp. W1]|uniref:Zn-dependent protease n=1 Tax=Haladaptatus sp. W1 TaxID=1897478 RepID=UPI000849CC62|nr:Zn-dependent protease [Haladaptatus sp. W1]ODR82416.1 Zn-dependent protease [Haladaptatus sp. W1]
MNIRFSARELRDLLVAWGALGLAFTLFLQPGFGQSLLQPGMGFSSATFVGALVVSLFTAGIGFLLHELAHKVVAIRFGQLAEFRADYNMLLLAIVGGLAGFLFAAPGAVYHRGMVTERENGLIALAGPMTNVVLGVLFFPLIFVGPSVVTEIGYRGAQINFLLAGFNMLPWGPLDGKKVQQWSTTAFLATVVPCVLLALYALLVL